MELLSPANTATLDAALEAGANAVYFGLKRLNARAGALNFSQAELPAAVARVHQHGAKAHLTLNIDLETREVAQAARALQCAAAAGVDAVIVRDPAILALRRFFPTLEFHLSTQSAVSASSGVRAARALGCDRVVLAREMSAAEIRRAAAEPGIATEVFIQGAMCFCASGRCLLSSWVGGRSGNRGECASPCRVAWRAEGGESPGHPMSMHDLCLLGHLDELRHAGVASLKIEGRLKSAAWVTKAVSLYRAALDRHAAADAAATAAELGSYTGRQVTDGYYAGRREGLTGEAGGRVAATGAPRSAAAVAAAPAPALPALTVTQDAAGGILLEFSCGAVAQQLRIPPQRVVKASRGVTLGEILDGAGDGIRLECPAELSAMLLPRRFQAAVATEAAAFRRRLDRPEDDGTIRCPLPPQVKEAVETALNEAPSPANRLHLGDICDRLRINFSQVVILAQVPDHAAGRARQLEVALDRRCSAAELLAALDGLPERFRGRELVVSLPPVCYEDELPELLVLLRECGRRPESIIIQANGWDTWQLAKETGVARMEAGPGLAVLNPAAAALLRRLGCECVAVSPEIDRQKLEALCQCCGTPLSLTVMGRPEVMTTRAELPPGFAPGANGPGRPFADGRGLALQAWRERGLTVLRPVKPFDWRRTVNPAVRVAHLVCDLRGSGDPAGDMAAPAAEPFLFNYDRTLR